MDSLGSTYAIAELALAQGARRASLPRPSCPAAARLISACTRHSLDAEANGGIEPADLRAEGVELAVATEC